MSAISNDFCARQRPANGLTLGAVEHSLGDCDTTHTWPNGGGGGADGGVDGGGGSDGGNGTGDAGPQNPQDGGPDGGNFGASGSPGDVIQAANTGCFVASSSASGAWVGLLSLIVVSRLRKTYRIRNGLGRLQ